MVKAVRSGVLGDYFHFGQVEQAGPVGPAVGQTTTNTAFRVRQVNVKFFASNNF